MRHVGKSRSMISEKMWCKELVIFFFKQKTAYEMCGHDWSSDVCSSDLLPQAAMPVLVQHGTADAVVPISHGRALAAVGPTAEFQSFAGKEHDLTFDNEVQTAQARWLAELGL